MRKKKTVFELKEETPVKQRVAIDSSFAAEAIKVYLNHPWGDAKTTQTLKEVLDLQQQVARLGQEIAQLQRAKETYGERQEQVRENIKTLTKSARNADLVKELQKNMAELETSLNKVTRELVEKDMKRSELTDRLSVLVQSITLVAKRAQ